MDEDDPDEDEEFEGESQRPGQAAGIPKGSGNPRMTKVGKVKISDLKKIAETKMPDLNANSIEEAMKIIEGTARSMGIEVL